MNIASLFPEHIQHHVSVLPLVTKEVQRRLVELQAVYGERVDEVVTAVALQVFGIHPEDWVPTRALLLPRMIADAHWVYERGGTGCEPMAIHIYRESHALYPGDYGARREFREIRTSEWLETLDSTELEAIVGRRIQRRLSDNFATGIDRFQILLRMVIIEPQRYQGKAFVPTAVDGNMGGDYVRNMFREAADAGKILYSVNRDTARVTGVPRKADVDHNTRI